MVKQTIYKASLYGQVGGNTRQVRVEGANSYDYKEYDSRVFLSVEDSTGRLAAAFLNKEQALEAAYHIINILQQQGELE